MAKRKLAKVEDGVVAEPRRSARRKTESREDAEGVPVSKTAAPAKSLKKTSGKKSGSDQKKEVEEKVDDKSNGAKAEVGLSFRRFHNGRHLHVPGRHSAVMLSSIFQIISISHFASSISLVSSSFQSPNVLFRSFKLTLLGAHSHLYIRSSFHLHTGQTILAAESRA